MRTVSELRELGEAWEYRFCELATQVTGRVAKRTALKGQRRSPRIRGRYIAPDVEVEPYEFHEIKHKKSTPRHGSHWYQWEDYRFASARALLDARILPWNAEFYHTIHDHRRVGVDSEVNDIRDWLTLPVSKMVTMFDAGECEIEDGRTTIRNSVSDVPTKLIWWPKSAWVPLATLPQYGNL